MIVSLEKLYEFCLRERQCAALEIVPPQVRERSREYLSAFEELISYRKQQQAEAVGAAPAAKRGDDGKG